MRQDHRPAGLASIAGAAFSLLAFSGCADRFVVDIPADAPSLAGEIAAPLAAPPAGLDCSAMRVEVAILYDPVGATYPGGAQSPVGAVAGRARPIEPPSDRALAFLQPYWLEGDVYENGVAIVTLYQSTALPSGPPEAVGAKPFSVFRGTLVGNRLDVVETPPSCGRRLTAEAGGDVLAITPDATAPGWRAP